MNRFEIMRMGLQNLSRRKLRTFLTVLSVMIGATSIVVMLSLGFGMRASTEEMIQGIGDVLSVTVRKGYDDMMAGGQGQRKGKSKPFDEKLAEEFKTREHVTAVIPLGEVQGNLKIGKFQCESQIIGIAPEHLEEFGIQASEGRLFTEDEKNVYLIGEDVLRFMVHDPSKRDRGRNWGGEDGPPPRLVEPMQVRTTYSLMDAWTEDAIRRGDQPGTLGRTTKMTCVGIMPSGMNQYGMSVIFPMETAKKFYKEKEKLDKKNAGNQEAGEQKNMYKQDFIGQMIVKVDNIDNIESVTKSFNDDGYQAYSDASWIGELQKSTAVTQAILGGIGSIALLVAAIGIANTMIMSTYERTREIGVMKVIGATVSDIRNLFLFEAGAIGLIGGVFGIAASYGISALINKLAANGDLGMFGGGQKISIIPPHVALLAMVFSALIGVVSGYFPARRATKLQAIEAIRTD